MPCGTMHEGKAGQTFKFQVTAGPKTCEGFLVSSNAATLAGGLTRYTDGELRAGQEVTIEAGFTYNLIIRRQPAAGKTTVRFVAPSGKVTPTTPCSSEGPIVGDWRIFA